MSEVFPTASELRTRKTKSRTIQEEISAIQLGILTADEAGAIETTLANTPFTIPGDADAEFRYEVFKKTETDRLVSLELSEVENYFSTRGYSIVKLTNGDTGNTFLWSIKW